MSQYEEIAHAVAADGTEAAWAARDAILELVAEVATLWEVVDEQTKCREVLERCASSREEELALAKETIVLAEERASLQAQLIADLRQSNGKQAELIEKQSETLKRLMGRGVLHA